MSAAKKLPTVRDWLAVEVRRAARTTPDGWQHANAEAFALAHGRPAAGGRFTVDECRYVLESALRAKLTPVVGQCWRNSRAVLLRGDSDRRLTYVEGFVGGHDEPIHHGWLEFEGKVVDVTLNAGAFGLTTVPPPKARWIGSNTPRLWGVEYFGVPFKRETVEAATDSEFAIADYGGQYTPTTLRDCWNGDDNA